MWVEVQESLQLEKEVRILDVANVAAEFLDVIKCDPEIVADGDLCMLWGGCNELHEVLHGNIPCDIGKKLQHHLPRDKVN
ncbi:hypothetical protein Pelo_9127 [Pelomyxa schiedti]|nr:hypothetical protein Pelo_9127 [Pelomyxa schiedti]